MLLLPNASCGVQGSRFKVAMRFWALGLGVGVLGVAQGCLGDLKVLCSRIRFKVSRKKANPTP